MLDKCKFPQQSAQQAAGVQTVLSVSSILTALGVVYGDIGTSTLYAFKAAMEPLGSNFSSLEVLGVLSLIFWSLIAVVSVKYIMFVLRADNQGEGGILALMSLLNPWGRGTTGTRKPFVIFIGLFGCALLIGDGIITPSVSVLSAIEGLKTVIPDLPLTVVLALTLGILLGLFSVQRKGTHQIGKIFGPIMLFWFLTQGLLGIIAIFHNPAVLMALNPAYFLSFIFVHKFTAFLVFGAVFLCLTGAEAMYADLGHCGFKPIRFAWFAIVLPSLVLNYFGQGALAISDHKIMENSFFALSPDWLKLPLVCIAALATVIASQALISGVFSLTRQAVVLGVCPRFNIIQTFKGEYGQIYVPTANKFLAIGCVILVLSFKTSDALASAYGIAVSMTMLITTVLLCAVMKVIWKWDLWVITIFGVIFLTIDSLFATSTMLKILEGGWVPICLAIVAFLMMSTWTYGNEILRKRLDSKSSTLEQVLQSIENHEAQRVPGTVLFMTRTTEGIPPVLSEFISKYHAVPEKVIIVHFQSSRLPYLDRHNNTEITNLEHGFWRVKRKYGYMQIPRIQGVVQECELSGLNVEMDKITVVLSNEIVSRKLKNSELGMITASLFSWMVRNSARPNQFFRFPKSQVLNIGLYVEL